MISAEANPWLSLSGEAPPYILQKDLESILRIDQGARPEHRIQRYSVPEPFIGSPETARLVLLSLNPGHDNRDSVDHARPEIKAALLRNLRHEPQDYPFYPLSPEFDGTGVAEWWRKRTKFLIAETGLNPQALSRRLLVIEWFPYHSRKCTLQRRVCESQKYSFSLASKLLKKDQVIVIGMRSKRRWDEVDKAFETVPYLNSPQNTCISRRNMNPELFDRIVRLLKQE